MMKIFSTFFLFVILVLGLPSISNAVEIEYGLPDSLSALEYWDKGGEFTDLATSEACPPILYLQVTPETGIAGALNTYNLRLTLPSSGIPVKGGFAFSFPNSFNLGEIDDVVYTDDCSGPDPIIQWVFVYNGKIAIRFKKGPMPFGGTSVTLTISSIRNPTVSGSYQIAGLIFNKFFRIVSGPTISESFDIFPAESIELVITPDEPVSLIAGTSQLFSASAFDEFGNEINNLDLTWSMVSGLDNIGLLSQGSLFATTVGVGRVEVSSGNLVDTSGLITVTPGAIDHFELDAYPSIVQAGKAFPSPVTIAVYDYFNNLKTDYNGSVFFISSDSLASFYHDSTNVYNFSPLDSGRHTFDGALFSLYTPGTQTISVTDGQHLASNGAIFVESGSPVSFNIVFDDSVMAGAPFNIRVTNAVDTSGNPANVLIRISLVQGGASPGGFEPILNDILVLNGTGSANQYLFRTGAFLLQAVLDSMTYNIPVDATPAATGNLSLDIQPTQFIGHPFIGPATITVYDLFGNIKTDFDASQTQATLNVNRGELIPNILDGVDDFADGVADLHAGGIFYEGNSGAINFSVSSGNIESSQYELIFNGIDIIPRDRGDSIFSSERYYFQAEAVNNGNLEPALGMTLSGHFTSCDSLCDALRSYPPIYPGEGKGISLQLPTQLLTPETEDTIVALLESGYVYNDDTILVTVSITDPMWILKPPEVSLISNSIANDTLLMPSTLDTVTLQFALYDVFDTIPNIHISSLQYYIDSTHTYSFHSLRWSGNCVNDTITIKLFDVAIPDITNHINFSEGIKALRFSLWLDYGNYLYVTREFDKFDSITILLTSELSYIENSLSPTTVFDNIAQSFSFSINLDGSTSININESRSRFELLYDDYGLMSISLADSVNLSSGSNQISTNDIYIPRSLIGKELTPRLILSGRELYAPRVDTILFGNERISVSEHTSIKPELIIRAANLITPNPPFVNHGQEFAISVRVENLSDFSIDSVSLMIQSEDGSEILAGADSIVLPANSLFDTAFILTAPDSSISSLIYKAVIAAPDADILPPDDNTIAVNIQSPAEIELSHNLIDVIGNRVEYGQVFSITALMRNLGEAEAGAGEVTLVTGGIDFGLDDSSSNNLNIDDTATWQLTAPSETVSADIFLIITGPPLDINSGKPAAIKTDSILIKINVQPSIIDDFTGNGILGETPLIIAGTTCQLFGLELCNNTSDSMSQIGLKSMIIEITNTEGEIISPDQILSPTESGFYNKDSVISSGEIYGNRLRFNFDNFRLYPGVADTIFFTAKINDVLSVSGFGLCLDSRDVKAIYVTGPRVNQTVPMTGKYESNLQIGANFVVVTSEFENSVVVKNNPFNPEMGEAEIAYYLNRDSDIEMNIYTLLGEKVFRELYPSGSNEGSQGKNVIRWDGKNDEGRTVMNGVYVVIIEAKCSGESYKLKLAVMK